ncbi:MAG: plasmid pRiA4b ORF-3 family protein [Lachnospiraceae bacterium]|nr:plasmid pRiA4b ORF-3 family protein [Lachnospiraceae bacterium]
MVGEEAVKDLFSDFSCEYKEGIHNDEVELFLKKNSVEFSKRKMSISYLVLDEQDRVAGYFTLTHKPDGANHEFCMNNRMYDVGNYQSDGDGKFQRSTKERIDRLRLVNGQKFSLHYDFGDDWMFVINVQRIDEAEEGTAPCVIQGKGSVTQYPDWDEFE